LLIKFIYLSLIKFKIHNMKKLIEKIILSKVFVTLFIYSSALIIFAFLMLGESLIETIIFNLLN
jgi:hypothetical protein